MRVLMISKACLVGIYQRKMEELARVPDMTLKVLVPPAWNDRGGRVPLERAHTEGYDLEAIPIAFNGNYHLHFYPTLGRHVRAFRPDIVHIDEEPYNLATWQAMRLSRAVGARALFFTWQNILRRYPPPFRWMEAYNYRHAAYAIAGNREAVAVLRAKGFSGPIAVIPQFGVDTERFAPDENLPDPALPFTVGFIGRMVPEKGVALLLEAMAGMDGDWRLVYLGDGPARAELEARAQAMGLASRVAFYSRVPSVEMPAYLRRLHALVLPSLTRPNWKEQFGRVLIEAMACGVPVVGSDSGEIPNVIGEAGLVFPEGDVEALRAALVRLRDDRDLRGHLAGAGRARVLAEFTHAQVAQKTYRVYREMLNR
ncbi:MAG: glycosyltransferase family 4 protein [Chloroflexi bacterium]|nr:glycosyltransferase family 4 protein [Chloroflexota bacterium]